MFIYPLFDFSFMSDMTRPTFVDKDKYVKFGNICRSNGREIGVVLNDVIDLYIKKGEKIFN